METNLTRLVNRLLKTYSERELAELAGVNVSTINRLKNGLIANPSSKVLVQLNKISDESP